MANTKSHTPASVDIKETLKDSSDRTARMILEELKSVLSSAEVSALSINQLGLFAKYAEGLAHCASAIIELSGNDDESVHVDEEDTEPSTIPVEEEALAVEAMQVAEAPVATTEVESAITNDFEEGLADHEEVTSQEVASATSATRLNFIDRPKGVYEATWKRVIWLLENMPLDVELQPELILAQPGADELFGEKQTGYITLNAPMALLQAKRNGKRGRGSRFIIPSTSLRLFTVDGENVALPAHEPQTQTPETSETENAHSRVVLTPWGLEASLKNTVLGDSRALHINGEDLSLSQLEQEKVVAMFLSLVTSAEGEARVVDVEKVQKRMHVLLGEKITYTIGHVRLSFENLERKVAEKLRGLQTEPILTHDEKNHTIDQSISLIVDEELLSSLGYSEQQIQDFLA